MAVIINGDPSVWDHARQRTANAVALARPSVNRSPGLGELVYAGKAAYDVGKDIAGGIGHMMDQSAAADAEANRAYQNQQMRAQAAAGLAQHQAQVDREMPAFQAQAHAERELPQHLAMSPEEQAARAPGYDWKPQGDGINTNPMLGQVFAEKPMAEPNPFGVAAGHTAATGLDVNPQASALRGMTQAQPFADASPIDQTATFGHRERPQLQDALAQAVKARQQAQQPVQAPSPFALPAEPMAPQQQFPRTPVAQAQPMMRSTAAEPMTPAFKAVPMLEDLKHQAIIAGIMGNQEAKADVIRQLQELGSAAYAPQNAEEAAVPSRAQDRVLAQFRGWLNPGHTGKTPLELANLQSEIDNRTSEIKVRNDKAARDAAIAPIAAERQQALAALARAQIPLKEQLERKAKIDADFETQVAQAEIELKQAEARKNNVAADTLMPAQAEQATAQARIGIPAQADNNRAGARLKGKQAGVVNYDSETRRIAALASDKNAISRPPPVTPADKRIEAERARLAKEYESADAKASDLEAKAAESGGQSEAVEKGVKDRALSGSGIVDNTKHKANLRGLAGGRAKAAEQARKKAEIAKKAHDDFAKKHPIEDAPPVDVTEPPP